MERKSQIQKIKIYKGSAEGWPVESWTSEANKSRTLTAPGIYLHEEALNSCLKVTDITFKVSHNGTVEVTNALAEKDAKRVKTTRL